MLKRWRRLVSLRKSRTINAMRTVIETPLFGAWVYNLVAKWVGGIEYTSADCAAVQVVAEKESAEAPAQE